MPTLHRLMFLLLFALALAPAAWCGAATAPQEKLLQLQKDFILRTADDLSRTLAFAEEMTAALQEEREDRTVLAYDDAGPTAMALLKINRETADWLEQQGRHYERDGEEFFARRTLTPGWEGRHESLSLGFQERDQAIGHTLRQLEQQRSALTARIDKITTTIKERRLLVALDDLELARKLWPDYDPRDFNLREARYVEFSETEILRLQAKLKPLDEELRYYEGLREVARQEQEWMRIKAAHFAKSLAVARALRSAPTTLPEALRDLLDTCERSREILSRAIDRLEQSRETPPAPSSIKALAHRQYQLRQLDLLKSHFTRQSEWLAGEIDSYRTDLSSLTRE